jgi:hypothetical protein
MATPIDLFVKEMQEIMETGGSKEEIESRYTEALVRYRLAQPSPYTQLLRKRFQEARGNPVAFSAIMDDINAYLDDTHKKAIELQVKLEMEEAAFRRLALREAAVTAVPVPRKSWWSVLLCRG